jgi:hypothetical protein
VGRGRCVVRTCTLGRGGYTGTEWSYAQQGTPQVQPHSTVHVRGRRPLGQVRRAHRQHGAHCLCSSHCAAPARDASIHAPTRAPRAHTRLLLVRCARLLLCRGRRTRSSRTQTSRSTGRLASSAAPSLSMTRCDSHLSAHTHAHTHTLTHERTHARTHARAYVLPGILRQLAWSGCPGPRQWC